MVILQEAYEEFIYSRRLSGSKPKTLEAYKSLVYPFIVSCGPDMDVLEVTNSHINAFIESVIDRHVSQGTLSTTVGHLKVFLQYMEDDYPVNYKLRKVKVPRMPKKVVRIYSDAEIVQIFQAVKAESPWMVYRNSAIIALMLDSGLRLSEAVGLLKANVDFDSCLLKVCGKGNKERVVPMGKFTRYFLLAYLDACPYEDDTRVFVGRRGAVLTTDAVKHMIYRVGECLPFEFSSHKLRHNFATNYCLDQYDRFGQVDIYRLMALMGHESVETTRRYLHFANQLIAARTSVSHVDHVLLPSGMVDAGQIASLDRVSPPRLP